MRKYTYANIHAFSRCWSMTRPQRGREQNWWSFPQRNSFPSPGCGSIDFRMGHRAVIRGGSAWALNEECVRHGAYLFSDCIWPKVIAVDMAWVVAYGNDEWWLEEQTTVKPNKCEVTLMFYCSVSLLKYWPLTPSLSAMIRCQVWSFKYGGSTS